MNLKGTKLAAPQGKDAMVIEETGKKTEKRIHEKKKN